MRADAARNSRRILDAARTLVAEHGSDVGMDEIARAAGVAVGTLYRRYPTKEALVAAVVDDRVDLFAQAAEAAREQVEAGEEPGAVLAALFGAFAEQTADDRALKAAAASLGGEPLDASGARFLERPAAARAVAATLAVADAARAAGRLRDDVGLEDLLALLHGVPEDPARRERWIDVVLTGLGLRPAR